MPFYNYIAKESKRALKKVVQWQLVYLRQPIFATERKKIPS